MTVILLVDDQKGTLDAIASDFIAYGQEVLTAQNIDDAARIFSQSISKLYAVVLDLRLIDPSGAGGDRSGFDLACRFRQFNRYIPIYIYSAGAIGTDIAEDNRINSTFRKGGDPDEDIDAEAVISSAQSYWDDFHRDDPDELLKIKSKYKIDESLFLKLIEPRTPLRHERVLEILLDDKDGSTLRLGENNDNEWEQARISKETFHFVDENQRSRSMTARVSYYSKPGGEFKTSFYSLPTVFSYGNSEQESLEHLRESAEKIYLQMFGDPELSSGQSLPASLSGADYLRVASFFSRVD